MQLAYNLMAMKIRDRIMAEPGVAAITEHMMDEFMTSLPMSRRKLIHGIVLSKHKDGWYIAVSLILYYGMKSFPYVVSCSQKSFKNGKKKRELPLKKYRFILKPL